jgi:hypothetical protein
VKLPAYSSLTAFMAHLQALRMAKPLTSLTREQSAWLAEMESIIGELTPAERESLENDGLIDLAIGWGASGTSRHRRRAERHLTQILRSRGVLSG